MFQGNPLTGHPHKNIGAKIQWIETQAHNKRTYMIGEEVLFLFLFLI